MYEVRFKLEEAVQGIKYGIITVDTDIIYNAIKLVLFEYDYLGIKSSDIYSVKNIDMNNKVIRNHINKPLEVLGVTIFD